MAHSTESQRRVFDEARKLIPGVVSCKLRGDYAGARELLKAVLEFAWEEGFCPQEAWSILFNAAMNWFMQAATRISTLSGESLEEILSEMAMLAAIMDTNAVG